MSSRVLLVGPSLLFLVMAALVALGGTAGASTAVPAPTLKLLAGTGVPGYLGDGGPAVGAQLYQPMGVAVDAAGNVLVADLSNRIRKITPDGIVTTVAGSGIAGFAGDGGPATNAQLNHPTGVIVDSTGGILIADQHNYRIRRVDPSGTITTIAGTGFSGYGMGDGGPALNTGLNLPTTLALDAKGGILIAEMGERRVRRIDPDGTISTVAGDSGTGYDGDNKPATEASLTKPTGLAVTPTGDVLIADQGDHRVRRVDPSGVIHTIAGNGVAATTGDGGQPRRRASTIRRACSWTARVACSSPKADRAPHPLDRARRHDQHDRGRRHERAGRRAPRDVRGTVQPDRHGRRSLGRRDRGDHGAEPALDAAPGAAGQLTSSAEGRIAGPRPRRHLTLTKPDSESVSSVSCSVAPGSVTQNWMYALPALCLPFAFSRPLLPGSTLSRVNTCVWLAPSHVIGLRWLCTHVFATWLEPSLVRDFFALPFASCFAEIHSTLPLEHWYFTFRTAVERSTRTSLDLNVAEAVGSVPPCA